MKRIKALPHPIQKQVFIRLLFGIGVAAVSVILSLAYLDYTFLPAILISIALAVLGLRIVQKYERDEFIVIQGTCKKIDTTLMKKRPKSIIMSAQLPDGDDVLLKIKTRRKHGIWEGCNVELCMDKKATLFEQENLYVVGGFLYIQLIH